MSWTERIRAHDAGTLEPVPARRAATVLLLRDTADGPAVYVLRRRSTMAFAAGMYAFPGGSVDAADAAGAALSDAEAAAWQGRLGSDSPETARAVLCAAVRETFEEAHVLFAEPAAATDADREALVAHETSLSGVLARHGAELRTDGLAPWARWITPEFEERRFDTWFFVAALPDGQRPRDVSGEADRALWTLPAEAVAGHEAGELAMLPPTLTALRELARYGSVAEVLAAAADRPMAPVVPRAAVDPDGALVLEWSGATPGRWSPSPVSTRHGYPDVREPGAPQPSANPPRSAAS